MTGPRGPAAAGAPSARMRAAEPARVRVAVNVMVEQWAEGTWPHIGPMGNPLADGLADLQAVSWAAYGVGEGVWRLLEVLAEHGVVATVYVSGMVAETAPDVVRAIAAGGHELCGHGWSQGTLQCTLSEEEERAAVVRCKAALGEAAGSEPTGWISPRCTPSPATPAALAAAGFVWWGDVSDADRPYRVATPSGTIVAVPFSMDVNDLPLHLRYGRPLGDLREAYAADLAGCRRRPGAHVDLTVHAHVSGRPAGCTVLADILASAVDDPDVELVTRGALADSAPALPR